MNIYNTTMSNYNTIKSLKAEHKLLVVKKIDLKEEYRCVCKHADTVAKHILEFKREYCDEQNEDITEHDLERNNEYLKSYRATHTKMLEQNLKLEKKLNDVIAYIDMAGAKIDRLMVNIEDGLVDDKQSEDDNTISDEAPANYNFELTSMRQSIEELTESANASE